MRIDDTRPPRLTLGTLTRKLALDVADGARWSTDGGESQPPVLNDGFREAADAEA